ncbi:MAG TPA: alpha/beta hydrolase [Pyrinomonadaceae bacterium]|jgi:pimeloyl-ACP methyl ester carboxylesterase
MNEESVKNIVLVHGAFADASGWEGVYRTLKNDGYNVAVVQNPTVSLTEDVAFTKRVIQAQDGPVVLVGHSYGGAVITEAGNDPQVKALVYIAGWLPDEGESVLTLIKTLPPDAPSAPITPPQDGFIFVEQAKFPASFAGDLDREKAEFMAASQVPWGEKAITETITEAAWKKKPSWYLISADDLMIPPEAQRSMSKRAGATVVESPGSHSIFISHPETVVKMIKEAAQVARAAAS